MAQSMTTPASIYGETAKVGVSFPILDTTFDECVEINASIRRVAESLIVFGPGGTSSPHVTIAMGTTRIEEVSDIRATLKGMIPDLGGVFEIAFGPVYRESVTGRYVISDVVVADAILAWRSQVQKALARFFSEPARTSLAAHLTLAHVESRLDEVDRVIEECPPLSPSVISRIDVSINGSKGMKLQVLEEMALDRS